ncbi:MAG: iron-sulfur cluster assembly scaffold protein, partial [Planctomycetota bacterium]
MAFEDLYQEIILDHYRNPRNYEKLEDNGLVTEHENPVCGDRLKLFVELDENQKIQKVLFDGSGCAIS